jgi:uncharacterized YigZ family protein
MHYPIPAATTRRTIYVSNSRFIASAGYTPNVETARDFIGVIRTDMPDATHHCYAYLVGYGASVTAGMSDDGEPAGTAGRPMLAVLRGADLGDVTVVVTRYFGGTLLGTGGLVRAYSEAVRVVLTDLPREQRVDRRLITVQIDYPAYGAVQRLLTEYDAIIVDETFGTWVSIQARVPLEHVTTCSDAIRSLTSGQALVE